MVNKKTDTNGLNVLRVQLLVLRLAILAIPIYLITASPTCGIFGPYLRENDFLLRVSLPASMPGLLFAIFGVLSESNHAVGISGVVLAIIMVLNQVAEPYFTIFDFVLLVFFIEVATSLTSFSEIAKSIIVGKDENVTYNYRVVLKEYAKRQVAIIGVTMVVSLGALLLVANVVPPFGMTGIALLASIAMLLVFTVFASRYYEK